MSLAAALELASSLQERADDRPLDWMSWTPPQDAFLRLNPPTGCKLFRAGNQATGKTTALMAEVVYRATGTHPHYRTKPPPIEVWVICTSWAQSVAIQRKFWDVAPKSELTPDTRDRFRFRDGWGKDNPAAEFMNGSLVRFRTTNQGAEALAGASVDYVAIDEPPDEEVFREARKRVTRTGGQVGMALTPVNKPCGWLREQVETGMIDEVHARLDAANMIPIGHAAPLSTIDHRTRDLIPMDQAWIDGLRATTPAMWAPVILDGEWEGAPQGVFFTCFDTAKHVTAKATLDPARGPIAWYIGFDYAAADRELGHVAVLVQVQRQTGPDGLRREAIIVTDEVALGGAETNSEFARRVVEMLNRHGRHWRDLSAAHGDNPVQSRWAMKSNIETMKALAVELQVPYNALSPRVLSAKEGTRSAVSRTVGCQYLFERIASRALVVHPRCETVIRGLSTWDYRDDHPLKDAVDALRYSLKLPIFAAPTPGRTVLRVA